MLSDQIPFMRRVGFDSFEVTHAPTRRALAEGRIAEVTLYYQPTGAAEPPPARAPGSAAARIRWCQTPGSDTVAQPVIPAGAMRAIVEHRSEPGPPAFDSLAEVPDSLGCASTPGTTAGPWCQTRRVWRLRRHLQADDAGDDHRYEGQAGYRRGSENSMIPAMTVPAAPMPVQTA